MPVLEIANLIKRYPNPDGAFRTIVDVPAFAMEPDQQTALFGRSGSGKTTFLHLVSGILRSDGGSVTIDNETMSAVAESRRDRLRARAIGYVFQTFNLLYGHSALENVELAMRFGRGVDRTLARELLERVGLAAHLHHRPSQLSVGQQQRVAVARALANHPKLVLADEPTGSLDEQSASDAIALIRTLCRENGAALLLVSHDRSILAQFDDVRDFSTLNQAAPELSVEAAPS